MQAVAGLFDCKYQLRDFECALPLISALIALWGVSCLGDRISVDGELHSVAGLESVVPPLRILLFRRAICLTRVSDVNLAVLKNALCDISVCESLPPGTTAELADSRPTSDQLTALKCEQLTSLKLEVSRLYAIAIKRGFYTLSAHDFQSKAIAWSRHVATPGDPPMLPASVLPM